MSDGNKFWFLEFPGVEEALDLCRWSNGWRLVQVFGECEVWYEGRASSYLGLGDRLVLFKPDGSLIVHRAGVGSQLTGNHQAANTPSTKAKES